MIYPENIKSEQREYFEKLFYFGTTDEEYINLNNAEQCDSCLYERVICLQEGACLLCKQKKVKENIYV